LHTFSILQAGIALLLLFQGIINTTSKAGGMHCASSL
jgi:hypothetical protein